jgi:hypothetical protein
MNIFYDRTQNQKFQQIVPTILCQLQRIGAEHFQASIQYLHLVPRTLSLTLVMAIFWDVVLCSLAEVNRLPPSSWQWRQ